MNIFLERKEENERIEKKVKKKTKKNQLERKKEGN